MNHDYLEDGYEYYERPRRRRKSRHGFLLILIIAVALLLITRFKFSAPEITFPWQGPSSAGAGKQETISGDSRQALETMAGKDPKIRKIMNDPQRYPARLLESLSRNPELADFTLDYPEKKGTGSGQTDLSGKYKPGTVPLLLQWDEQWGYARYGSGIIGTDGCGPTCLSMVAVGLTGNTRWNPAEVALFSEQNGYLDEPSNSTLWTLMSKGAEKLGLSSSEIPLSESRMAEELSQRHPIICSLGPGDFTTQGHFIVLTGYKDGSFTVHDPNSRARSGRLWNYETLKPQIRNLWAFSA